jgi:hypothetical protein
MNFYFTKTKKSYLNFTEHQLDKHCYLYLDQGWSKESNFFFKGTHDSWCKIYSTPSIKVETNKFRDFPIYYNKNSFTNFEQLENILPVDGIIEHNNKVHISFVKDFYPTFENNVLNFDQCHNILFDSLLENFNNFLSTNSKPIFVPLQKGIDTLTVRSVFDYLGAEYTLFDLPTAPPSRSPHGDFLSKKFWGFSQIEEKDNAVIVTGFYGDEWILRNPYYVHILLSQRDIDICKEFDRIETCYMKNYFENYRTKCSEKTNIPLSELISQICNDFQIWHLNNTYFFSPLKHENLLNLLHADTNTVIGQVTAATLSKSIIERCNPNLLGSIDELKNQNDPDYFL